MGDQRSEKFKDMAPEVQRGIIIGMAISAVLGGFAGAILSRLL